MQSTKLTTINDIKQDLLNKVENGIDISNIQLELKLSATELFNIINCGADSLLHDNQVIVHENISDDDVPNNVKKYTKKDEHKAPNVVKLRPFGENIF